VIATTKKYEQTETEQSNKIKMPLMGAFEFAIIMLVNFSIETSQKNKK